MLKIDEGKTTSSIAVVIIIFVISLIVIEIFKVKYNSITIIVILSSQFFYIFMMTYGDWIPVPRGKQINFDSGIAGSLRGKLISHPGNMMTAMVSFEKRLLDEEIIKENRVGGIHYLLDWLTFGNVTIYITGKKWQWMEIPANQSDNKSGAIRFIGNVRGKEIWNENDYPIFKALNQANSINKAIVAQMEEMESQLLNLAEKQFADLDKATQYAKEFTDRMKNIRVMVKGKGGDSEGLAAEIGQ